MTSYPPQDDSPYFWPEDFFRREDDGLEPEPDETAWDPATEEARALAAELLPEEPPAEPLEEALEEPVAAVEEPRPQARAARLSLFAPLAPEEQEQLQRALQSWTRPGCSLGLTFALTLALWAWAVLHPQPVLWLLGALVTPWATLVVSVALGLVLGERSALRRGIGIIVGLGLAALLIGLGVGFIARASALKLPPMAMALVTPDMTAFVATLVAAVWATVLLARRRTTAVLPGVALTWTLALPLFWAGIFLVRGESQAAWWALVAFATHLFWAWVLAGVTLIVLGLYPPTWDEYGLLMLFFILGVFAFLLYAEADLQRRSLVAAAVEPVSTPTTIAVPSATPRVEPSPTPRPSPTSTPTPRPTPTVTPSPVAAVATYTIEWPTATPSPTATPIYAVVQTSERYIGLYVREGPGYSYPSFTGLLNGTKVIVLSEPVEADDTLWIKVRFEEYGQTKEGWVLYYLLVFVTPTPTPLE